MSIYYSTLAVSWALFGLIWVVQLVHYPSFRFIDKNQFLDFHKRHTRSITIIVMPLMLLELGLSFWSCYLYQFEFAHLVPFLMVLGIWSSTFLIQIPIHQKLSKVKDELLINRLIKTNWIRTILWSIKSIWISVL